MTVVGVRPHNKSVTTGPKRLHWHDCANRKSVDRKRKLHLNVSMLIVSDMTTEPAL